MDDFPFLKLRLQFTGIEKIRGIHGSNIRIAVHHSNDGHGGTANSCSGFERRKQVSLKIVAHDDQIVRFGWDAELVPLQIGDDGVDGQTFSETTLPKNFDGGSRVVHGCHLPATFRQPHRMPPGAGCQIEYPAWRERRRKTGDQRMRLIGRVLALAVTFVPIGHSSII